MLTIILSVVSVATTPVLKVIARVVYKKEYVAVVLLFILRKSFEMLPIVTVKNGEYALTILLLDIVI